MKIHDVFISKYKELEQSLDISVKEYEESLPDDRRQKLYLCRITRNYIQHNDDYNNFIEVSEGMLKFISEEIYKIQSKNGILKDFMTGIKKYGCAVTTDTVFSAAATMKAKGINEMPVLDTDGHFVCFITKEYISDLFGAGLITKVTPIKNIKEKTPFIKSEFMYKNTLMNEVHKKIAANNSKYVIVVNTNNTVCGILPANYAWRE